MGGGGGGLTVQFNSFGNLVPHLKFQNPSTAPSGVIWERVVVLIAKLSPSPS
jgi:hypothetical protein